MRAEIILLVFYLSWMFVTPLGMIGGMLYMNRRIIAVRPIFKWYDAWMGFFWDRYKLYVLPIPMCGLVIEFHQHRYDILMDYELINEDNKSKFKLTYECKCGEKYVTFLGATGVEQQAKDVVIALDIKKIENVDMDSLYKVWESVEARVNVVAEMKIPGTDKRDC